MCKNSSATIRFKIVNSLPRIATSTANTLTAIAFSFRSCNGRWYRGLNKDQYCREYNVLVCFQLDIASHRLVNN